jgi:hypothetical protein
VDKLAHSRGLEPVRRTTFRSGQDALIVRKPIGSRDNTSQL